MKNKTFEKTQKRAVKMGDIAYKEYVDGGALEALNASARAYNTAMRVVQTQLMYKNQKK